MLDQPFYFIFELLAFLDCMPKFQMILTSFASVRIGLDIFRWIWFIDIFLITYCMQNLINGCIQRCISVGSTWWQGVHIEIFSRCFCLFWAIGSFIPFCLSMQAFCLSYRDPIRSNIANLLVPSSNFFLFCHGFVQF